MVRPETSAIKVVRNEISSVTAALRRNARWSAGHASTSFTSALLFESQPESQLPSHASIASSAAAAPAADRTRSSTTLPPDEASRKTRDPSTPTKSHLNRSTGPKKEKSVVGPALFADLQLELKQVQDSSDLDAQVLLRPFLEIVRSGDTSGPITSVALSALDKFITLELIHPGSPSLIPALQDLSEAGTHCKFEASDSVSDELVLFKIQDVLLHTISGPLGQYLSDEAVCSMMETVLGLCCQMRLSELLRRTSEKTMHSLVMIVFQRLQSIPDEEGQQQQPSTLGTNTSSSAAATPQPEVDVSISAPDPTAMRLPAVASSPLAQTHFKSAPPAPASPSPDADAHHFRTYGLPSIAELLRVLVDLLDPHDPNHTDSMRLLSVNLLTTVFEVGGTSIGRFPALRNMVSDRLCKFLLQLASTATFSNNQFQVMLTAASLRLWTHLLETLKHHLKLQQELLISFLMDRLAIVPGREAELEWDRKTWDAASNEFTPVPLSATTPTNPLSISTNNLPDRSNTSSPTPSMLRAKALEAQSTSLSPEIRALLLEHLCLLAREPDTALMLWQNYDCQIDSEDLWERLVRFFSRGVYPMASQALVAAGAASSSTAAQLAQHNSQDATQLMCLDTVLAFVGFMAERAEIDQQNPQGSDDARALSAEKAKKQVLLEGASLFNEKPKKGLAFWEESGILYADCGADASDEQKSASLAKFIKECPKLDKRVLGDWISAPAQIQVLTAYMRLFDFNNKIISDAMRELLETFRLPGEAQPISRITEVFADAYFFAQSDKTIVRSQDAAYVLAYSVIMLNTDQHNPQNVKNRMKLDDYRKNLRGVNEKEDFPSEYLEAIYIEIKRREIVLPEEHHGALGFDFAWRELLRRSRSTKPLQIVHSFEQDRELFMIGWKPVVSAISYAFTHFKDDWVLQKALAGFQQVADLASRFELPEVFDHIIFALARITGLSPGPEGIDTATFPKVEVPVKGSDQQQQEIIISPLSVRFGTNVKAQLAAVVLFSIANTHGASIRSGWSHIIEVYQTLFLHSLLPPSLLSMEDFLAGTSVIPLKPREQPAVREDTRADAGLLSTLSSYLLSPYANVGTEGLGRELTEDDIDDTLSTVDCIASCRLEELYASILSMPSVSLTSITEALVGLLDRLGRPRRGSATNQSPSTTSTKLQAPYDPSVVFLLELMIGIASNAPQGLAAVWPTVLDCVQNIISNATYYSPLLVERAVVGVLRLASSLAQDEELHPQFIQALELLHQLPAAVLGSVADQLTAGLIHLLTHHHSNIEGSSEWALVLSFFASTAHRSDAAKSSFAFIRSVFADKTTGGLSSENYTVFVDTLNAFASAASAQETPGGTRLQSEPLMERGRQALDMIRDSQGYIDEFSAAEGIDFTEAWERYWLPVLSAYSQQCTNACREIRQAALGHLQRTLIAYEILSNPGINLSLVFERLVFPMLDELLKPQVFRRDPAGMGETRLRAAALLCKIFLHCATQRQGMDGLLPIWGRVLDALDRMMHSGRKDAMYEAVPEQLKNAVLVMAAQEILVPPTVPSRTDDQVKLWDATFTRIDTFLPNLQQELFPNAPARRPTKVVDFSTKGLEVAPSKSSDGSITPTGQSRAISESSLGLL